MWSSTHSVYEISGDGLPKERKVKLDNKIGHGVIYDQSQNKYYVEKSTAQLMGEYSLKTLATPVTVTIDSVPYILYGVLFIASNSGGSF